MLVGSQDLERRISEQLLRFFMELCGNEELLNQPLVAFFASRNSPPEALMLAQQWAREISQSDKVVISGFHSPIERAVLDILLANNRPVIVTLGRSLYRRIRPYLEPFFEKDNLLFISFRNQNRANLNNSQLRNWATVEFAQEVIFAPFLPNSQLSSLWFFLCNGTKPAHILQ